MDDKSPRLSHLALSGLSGQEDHGKLGFETTEFNFEIRCILRGHLEAIVASEAINVAVRVNMHMDTRVIEVIYF